tara:strand:- start:5562 stop:5807 length:246 start_codon:yes stop_codon:yes gene_type:complete
MNAAEARIKTAQARAVDLKAEYDSVQSAIEFEVLSGNGKYEVAIYGTLMVETVETLTDEGYRITGGVGAGFNETSTIISWK